MGTMRRRSNAATISATSNIDAAACCDVRCLGRAKVQLSEVCRRRLPGISSI
jgi:hypothetical protein